MLDVIRLKNWLLRTDPIADADWLEALFATTPPYKTAFFALRHQAGWMEQVADSTWAMRSIAGSGIAMEAVSTSAVAMGAIWDTAAAFATVATSPMAIGKYVVGCAGLVPHQYADIGAVAASSTAMSAVAASSTAMSAVAASGTARAALWESDTALTAIQNDNRAVEALIASGKTTSKNYNSSSITFEAQGKKLILLRRYYNINDESDHLRWDRTTGNLPGYGAKALTYGVNYATTTGVPTANNATANNVRACNGLSRGTWSVGRTLYVIYLLV